MINRVVLVGNLTKDVNLKQTRTGKNVAMFTLAVSRQFKDASGNREADFIQCIAWRKTAEILNQYAHKGSKIGIEGRIQTRTYDDKDGKRVYVTEVIADNATLLDPKPTNQNTGQGNYQQAQDQFTDQGYTDISDDSLPF